MTDTGLIIAQGLPLGEFFAVGTDDHVVTVSGDSILPDQSGHAGEFLTTNGTVLSWAAVSGGSGTVTTVSVVTANGVSGSVANATTTPAITLTLGAITPTSVNASGTVLGSNLSGTNTGDQTITLTSDVTGTGTGSFATTIAANAVTYAKMQAVSGTSKILGSSSTTTPVQELSLGSGLSLTGTTLSATGTGGTVTSIDVSGGTTGLTTSGGPVTGSGTITLAGTLAIANGGTGQTTAANAINALLPTQTGHSGEFLTTNGTVASWASLGAGIVTSITGTANQVIASAATGAVTLSLPQSIATSSTPQFAREGLGLAADSVAPLSTTYTDADTGTAAVFPTNPSVMIDHASSGTPTSGFGNGILAKASSATVASRPIGGIAWKWGAGGAVDAGRFSRIELYGVNNSTTLTPYALFAANQVAFPNQTAVVTGVVVSSSGSLTTNTLAAASVLFGASTSTITGNSTNLTYGATTGFVTKLADALTNTVADGLTIGHNATGTQANGFGVRALFQLESSTTADQNAIGLTALWTDATHASRTAALVLSGVNNATAIAEWARLKNGVLTLGVSGTLLGELDFAGSTSGTTILKAAAAAGGTFTLPAADGSAGQALITNGSGVLSFGTASTKVFSNTSVPAGNTIANTAAETAFSSSYTIPANALAAGNVIRVKLWGVYSTALVAPTIQIKLKIGSTVVLDSGAISAIVGSVSNLGWSAEADLSWFTIGAAGTVDAQASGKFATAAFATATVCVPNTATATIDTTTTQAVTVTVTWSAANASNTITLRQMNIELLK